MKIHKSLSKLLLFGGILVSSMAAVVWAEEPTTIKLTLHPQAIEDHGPSRPLLPEAPDLKPGNAAVVLLRMPWAQRTWMEEWSPKLFELLELPPGDPRVGEFPFDRFAAEMRRAAFMRNADWAYPLEDESLDSISTPDILELPIFFRGMSIWTDQRIAAGDLDAAREGVLTMLACSRHVARTPMSIPHLVARGTAEAALSRVESLISQPHSPNLHASLSLLPDAIGDCRAALQWEAQNPKRLLPALRNGVPSSGDTQGWKAVMDDFLRWESNPWRKEETISADLEARRLELAAEARAAVARGGYAVPDRPISEDELGMGYLLAKTARAYFRAEAAWRLPPPDAIRALADMNAETDAIFAPGNQDLGSVLSHVCRHRRLRSTRPPARSGRGPPRCARAQRRPVSSLTRRRAGARSARSLHWKIVPLRTGCRWPLSAAVRDANSGHRQLWR